MQEVVVPHLILRKIKAGIRQVFLIPLGRVFVVLVVVLALLLWNRQAIGVAVAEAGVLSCQVILAWLGCYVSLSDAARQRAMFFATLFILLTGGVFVLDMAKNRASEAEAQFAQVVADIRVQAQMEELRRQGQTIEIIKATVDIIAKKEPPMAKLPPSLASDIEAIKNQTAPPPPPRITWRLEQVIERSGSGTYRIVVSAMTDTPINNGKIFVWCDRPCKPIGASIARMAQWELGKVPEYPNIAAFIARLPNPIPSGVPISLTVEADDGLQFRVIKVGRLLITSEGDKN